MKLLIIPSNNNKKDTNLCLATAQLQLDCSDSILNLLKGKCRLYKIHGEDKRYMSNIRYIYVPLPRCFSVVPHRQGCGHKVPKLCYPQGPAGTGDENFAPLIN